MSDERRGVIGILAAVGIGLLAAVLVMATLRAEQQTNADAIRALEERAQAAEVSAQRAQDDAAEAQRELRSLQQLVQALQDQVRALGGVPVSQPPSGSAAPPVRPSSEDEPAAPRPTAAPSPPPASAEPRPTPQPTPTPSPTPSPSPPPLVCVGRLCIGGP